MARDPQYAGGVERRPELDRHFQTNIKGLHIIGAANGSPLLKTCINEGVEVIRSIQRLMPPSREPGEAVDLIIVGAGPAGLSAALEAQERGYRFLLFEHSRPLNTILNFPQGKHIYAEPDSLPTLGELEFADATKEELLERWERQAAKVTITRASVQDVQKEGPHFRVTTDQGEHRARRVILAMGRLGNPRHLGVPGEDLPCVYTQLLNPGKYRDRQVVVIGGGNSAAEAALALTDANRVTLVHRGDALPRLAKINRDLVDQKQREGKLQLLLRARALAFRDGEVDLEVAGRREPLPCDVAFVLIGAEPPTRFLKRSGILFEGQLNWARAFQYLWMLALVWSIYGIKFDKWPFRGIYASLTAARVEPGLLYGILYTAVLSIFGIRALLKYRGDPYQVKRYRTLIACQWLIYFLLPWGLFYAGYAEWWRTWGVTLTYPLGYYGLWEPAGRLFHGSSLPWAVATVVAFVLIMPLASARHGKRFCSWICPCGGMADTLGDVVRHKSPRGQGIRRLEAASSVLLVVTVLCSLYLIFGYRIFGADAAGRVQAGFKLVVDLGLASVVAISLYPFAGNRIWCRFFCPLAKWMERWGRWTAGKLAILPNDECISCGECTRYCQMGIDVRAFAQRGLPLSNLTTCCIFCGICVTVCPVDVLSLQHLPEGSDSPLLRTGSPG